MIISIKNTDKDIKKALEYLKNINTDELIKEDIPYLNSSIKRINSILKEFEKLSTEKLREKLKSVLTDLKYIDTMYLYGKNDDFFFNAYQIIDKLIIDIEELIEIENLGENF